MHFNYKTISLFLLKCTDFNYANMASLQNTNMQLNNEMIKTITKHN